VSTKILLAMVVLPLVVIVFTTEILHLPRVGALSVCKQAAVSTGWIFIRFWVSLTFNIALNMVLKTLTAVPRPHFIDTCKPLWEKINCSHHGGYMLLILQHLVQSDSFLAMSRLTFLYAVGLMMIQMKSLMP